ncbi:hypothetical protein QBC39DRAFT_429487 [Podospora conica]|nr:hypothetical protein QBC39DRAFT_429487 [Schizothecium conicum]
MRPGPPPAIQRVKNANTYPPGTFGRALIPNNTGVNNVAVTAVGNMDPSLLPITPTPTPETPDKVTGEVIARAEHGTITGSCHRLQCLGYIIKIITDQNDTNGWHLECNRKEDRIRPCNFRRDAYGNTTSPLPRPPPPTPTLWRGVVQRSVGDSAKGPTPITKGGAAPGSSTANSTAQIGSNTNGGAQKKFGSTQRVLFPPAVQVIGKRTAGNALDDPSTPATKRQCGPVRNNFPGSLTVKVEDEFDDIDLGWLDAATRIATAMETGVGSKAGVESVADVGSRAEMGSREGMGSMTDTGSMAPAANPQMKTEEYPGMPSPVNATPTKAPRRNHQQAQPFPPAPQFLPTPPTTTPQYSVRMGAVTHSVSSPTVSRAGTTRGTVAMPPRAPRQHGMPPPPRQRQKQHPKQLKAWTPQAAPPSVAPASAAPGGSHFEPIVLD